MALTSAQIETLAADLAANVNQAVVDALAAGDNNALVAWYNGEASPAFWVLKSAVAVDELIGAMDWAADYAAFKDDVAAIALILQNGTYNPQPPQARDALNVVFAAAASTKANVLALATRQATEAEKLFAVGTTGPGGGDGSAQANSAIPAVEGDISRDDIRAAVALIP